MKYPSGSATAKAVAPAMPSASASATSSGPDQMACDLVQRFERMVSQRGPYESLWQEVKELVNPSAKDFNRQVSPGQTRSDKIYDGTAPQSNVEFAGGLHSYLTSQTERWFFLSTWDKRLLRKNNVLKYLETVSDTIYAYYSKPNSGFNTSSHECYLSDGAFGTSILFQDYDPVEDVVRFRAIPLADCFIEEDFNGLVDTCFRRVKWTARQAIQRFGKGALSDKITKCAEGSQCNQEFMFVHCVYPRTDYDASKMDGPNRPFASYWIDVTHKLTVEESGYYTNPYHVSRWMKLAGEVYGYSPALSSLPDIRSINKLQEIMLKAAQLAIAPPLQVPSESFLAPINTKPWGLNFFDRDNDSRIEPIPLNARPDITDKVMEQVRGQITKAYFVDYIRMQQKKERQTAFEIADGRDEMGRLMGPQLGRKMMEMLGPAIARTFDLLNRAGKFPPPPQELLGARLRVEYTSPAAQAQLTGKAANLGRFIQALVPIGQVDPTVFDVINTTEYASEIALALAVPRSVLADPAEVAAKKQAAQNQQQLLASAQAGGQIAGAAKDLADAHATTASSGAPLNATP